MNRLENFRLSEEEGVLVDIEPRDVKSSETQCEQSLVGRMFGDHSVNYTGLKQTHKIMVWGRGN